MFSHVSSQVTAAVVWKYVKAGGISSFIVVMLFLALFTVSQIVTQFWLRKWSATQNMMNTTHHSETPVKFYLGMYGVLGIAQSMYFFKFIPYEINYIIRQSGLLRFGARCRVTLIR